MRAVVLCAGKGTRLGPLTKKTPKPMLPILGVPMLAYTLRHLSGHGIRDVAINLHFEGRQIVDYFEGGGSHGLRITYFEETELLGTAGALPPMADWLGADEEVLVIYGDILTDQNLSILMETHREQRAFATLLVHHRLGSNSVIRTDEMGRIGMFLERPTRAEVDALGDYPESRSWVNSCVQVLSRSALDFIADTNAVDLPRDVYAKVVHKERLFAVPLSGYRVAVDSPKRYDDAQRAVADGRCRFSGHAL